MVWYGMVWYGMVWQMCLESEVMVILKAEWSHLKRSDLLYMLKIMGKGSSYVRRSDFEVSE